MSIHNCLAFAIALHLYLAVELFNILPFVEFIGIHELDVIRNIKSDNIAGIKGSCLGFSPA